MIFSHLDFGKLFFLAAEMTSTDDPQKRCSRINTDGSVDKIVLVKYLPKHVASCG